MKSSMRWCLGKTTGEQGAFSNRELCEFNSANSEMSLLRVSRHFSPFFATLHFIFVSRPHEVGRQVTKEACVRIDSNTTSSFSASSSRFLEPGSTPQSPVRKNILPVTGSQWQDILSELVALPTESPVWLSDSEWFTLRVVVRGACLDITQFQDRSS